MPRIKAFIILRDFCDGLGYRPAVDTHDTGTSMLSISYSYEELHKKAGGDDGTSEKVLPVELRYIEPEADFTDRFFLVTNILMKRLQLEDSQARVVSLEIMGRLHKDKKEDAK